MTTTLDAAPATLDDQRGPESSDGDRAPTPLPELVTTLRDDEIRARLDAASRRGKLPGLAPLTDEGLFEIRELGVPFEHVMLASPADSSTEGEERRVAVKLRLRPLFPVIFSLIMVVSIWPGILLVDSMLRKYFAWYTIETWWWYYPLTIPTTPWVIWSSVRKSREAAQVAARQTLELVAGILGARLAEPVAGPGT